MRGSDPPFLIKEIKMGITIKNIDRKSSLLERTNFISVINVTGNTNQNIVVISLPVESELVSLALAPNANNTATATNHVTIKATAPNQGAASLIGDTLFTACANIVFNVTAVTRVKLSANSVVLVNISANGSANVAQLGLRATFRPHNKKIK